MKNDQSLGDRMKANYENRYQFKLTRRTPVILRLDGKAFHSVTQNCKKPFDEEFATAMSDTAELLCHEIQGTKCTFVQSDEMSLLLTDFDTLTTEGWFDYNLQKMVSVAAGMATLLFNERWHISLSAIFDCRAFNVPIGEVCNYFIWRQKDWKRNSIQMLGQKYFSHKELYKKSLSDIHEMLHEKGENWAKLEPKWKRGWFIGKVKEVGWRVGPAPVFTEKREIIEDYLKEAGND